MSEKLTKSEVKMSDSKARKGQDEPGLSQKLKPGRPHRTHGGYSFIVSGTLPAHRIYLLRYLSACREGLIRDLGGDEDNLNTAQRILIDRVISKLGILRLIEEHAKDNGIFEGAELISPLKENYLAYANSVRIDLTTLGIDSKPPEALAPFDLVKKEEAQKRGKK